MDLEKNIEIAFGVYWKNLPVTTELNTGTHLEAFITGAKSQAAKDFWYNEFKRELWNENFQKSINKETIFSPLKGKVKKLVFYALYHINVLT